MVIELTKKRNDAVQRLAPGRRFSLVSREDRLRPDTLRTGEPLDAFEDEPIRRAEDLLFNSHEVEALRDHHTIQIKQGTSDRQIHL